VLNAFIDASEQQPDIPVAAMAHFFRQRWEVKHCAVTAVGVISDQPLRSSR
jgi:hypothetical protein